MYQEYKPPETVKEVLSSINNLALSQGFTARDVFEIWTAGIVAIAEGPVMDNPLRLKVVAGSHPVED